MTCVCSIQGSSKQRIRNVRSGAAFSPLRKGFEFAGIPVKIKVGLIDHAFGGHIATNTIELIERSSCIEEHTTDKYTVFEKTEFCINRTGRDMSRDLSGIRSHACGYRIEI